MKHGCFPHPVSAGCDEWCPREYPGHGPYPHARSANCTEMCDEVEYSKRAAEDRRRWEEREFRKWKRRGQPGAFVVDGILVAPASGIDLERKERLWVARADGVALSPRGQAEMCCGGDYFIDRGRVDTAAKAAVWAHHLSDKEWVTKEALRDFLEVALEGAEGGVPWLA